jgi:glycerol-3-phosphate acyltransferase PlsY
MNASGINPLILAGLAGYLLGSFPTAYLVVRWQSNLDIRSAGSGNVGTLNSYEVTRSWWVGGIVLLADVAKGSGAVVLAGLLSSGQGAAEWLAAVCSVIGHTASPWIGFRGGRGLATAAGAVTMNAWPTLPIWLMLWLAGYILFRSVNPANALACVGVLAAAVFLPSVLLSPRAEIVSLAALRAGVSAIMLVILARLYRPVLQVLRTRRSERR